MLASLTTSRLITPDILKTLLAEQHNGTGIDELANKVPEVGSPSVAPVHDTVGIYAVPRMIGIRMVGCHGNPVVDETEEVPCFMYEGRLFHKLQGELC